MISKELKAKIVFIPFENEYFFWRSKRWHNLWFWMKKCKRAEQKSENKGNNMVTHASIQLLAFFVIYVGYFCIACILAVLFFVTSDYSFFAVFVRLSIGFPAFLLSRSLVFNVHWGFPHSKGAVKWKKIEDV